MVNLRLKRVNIIMIGKASCRVFVSQISRPWKEAVRIKLLSYKWNSKEMWMIHPCVRGLASSSWKGQVRTLGMI